MCFFVFRIFRRLENAHVFSFLEEETRLCFWTEPSKHVCVLKRNKKTPMCFGVQSKKNECVFFDRENIRYSGIYRWFGNGPI